MRTFSPFSSVGSVLADPTARAVLEAYAPDLAVDPVLALLPSMPVIALGSLDTALNGDDETRNALFRALGEVEDRSAPPRRPEFRVPRGDYEALTVERGSARMSVPASAERNALLEIEFAGPSHGNPFVDVDLVATFTDPEGGTVEVGGFYDGDGRYLVRVLPEVAGELAFTTRSNARSLDGIRGAVPVAEAGNPGVVRVAETFHFRHEDGTRYVPVGTTVYALIHQPDDLQEETLESLRSSPFTKLRLCVFPKSYLHNTEEPTRFPFPRDTSGAWDTTRFDPDFFAALDRRIVELGEAGIQADLILFHPYDRWGFIDLGAEADDHYTRYVVRRYAAYPHLWWSLANEHDLIGSKSEADWERIAEIVATNDHAHHLVGIHNCFRLYDQTRPWITHASLQRLDVYRTAENVDAWRTEWQKPIVLDEAGYEGDLDPGWGNLTGEELVRRFWEGAVRGGYVQHGETFDAADDVIWWSKGGRLRGTSPERIRFLAGIIADAPDGVLDPLPSSWDAPSGGVEGRYVLTYFGFNQPRSRTVSVRRGTRYHVDVIDTWAMTIERLPGTFEGRFSVELPGRPYQAIRLTALNDEETL